MHSRKIQWMATFTPPNEADVRSALRNHQQAHGTVIVIPDAEDVPEIIYKMRSRTAATGGSEYLCLAESVGVNSLQVIKEMVDETWSIAAEECSARAGIPFPKLMFWAQPHQLMDEVLQSFTVVTK